MEVIDKPHLFINYYTFLWRTLNAISYNPPCSVMKLIISVFLILKSNNQDNNYLNENESTNSIRNIICTYYIL